MRDFLARATGGATFEVSTAEVVAAVRQDRDNR